MARSRELSALINTVAADGTTGKLSVDPTNGQAYGVIESQVGTDYNSTLYTGYFCRAWVKFNGTGTPAIEASGNVSSITDGGTGIFTANFTTAMPDATYAAIPQRNSVPAMGLCNIYSAGSYTTSALSIYNVNAGNTVAQDPSVVTLSIFR